MIKIAVLVLAFSALAFSQVQVQIQGQTQVQTGGQSQSQSQSQITINTATCQDPTGIALTHGPTAFSNDCEKFFQCSNGIISIQVCGPGTVFNPVTANCDFPFNVPGCNGGSVVPIVPLPEPTTAAPPALSSKCSEKVTFDMMLVLDESGSIGTDNFEIAKDFANQITSSFQTGIDNGDINVGVITFDSGHRTQIPMQTYSYADLSSLISGLSYRRGGTLIGAAMEYANEEFLIASPDPDRRKVMLVVTDGNSADDPKDAADASREAGILPLAVGVANYNVNQLLDIVGNNSLLIFEVADFNDLVNYASNISEVICTSDCATNPCLNGATCLDTEDSFVCTCPKGWTGKFCSVSDNPCLNNPCQNGGVCKLTTDNYVCVCRNGFAGENCTEETRTCTGHGDPHYETFDGKRYNFQGTCEYVFARSLSTDMNEYFQIITENEHRNGDTRVSWLKRVTVSIIHPLYGEIHAVLSRDPQISVGLYDSLNNQIVLGDYKDDVGSIASGHNQIVIRFRGVVVRYDGFKVQVTVPDRYFAQVEGLCGNYNGHELDEFVTVDGGILDANGFGQSHVFGTCGDAPPAQEDPCSTDQRLAWAADRFCGAILSGNGTFADCLSHVDLQQFATDCTFDMCATNGDLETFSKYLTAVADFCSSEQHPPQCDWRQRIPNAPAVTCPANSHYSGCMSACPNTCLEPNAAESCTLNDVEGCECDDGYVFHRGECIESATCGCLSAQYGYVDQGFTATTNDCALTCSCVAPNGFICVQNGCSPDEVCTQVGIDYQCQVPAVDPCLSNPCQNGGVCRGDIDAQTFVCRCPPGFSGANCEDIVVPSQPADDECRNVPEIENGRHHWFQNEGNWPAEICRVQYECNDGFQLTGHRDLYCYKGHWSGAAPVCEVVMCDPLQAPENAAFEFVGAVPPYMMYSIAEFTCNKGFEISGDHDYVLICLPDRIWSNTPPVCDAIVPCHDEEEKPVTPVKPSSPKTPSPSGSKSPSPSKSPATPPSPKSPATPASSKSPATPPSPKSPASPASPESPATPASPKSPASPSVEPPSPSSGSASASSGSGSAAASGSAS